MSRREHYYLAGTGLSKICNDFPKNNDMQDIDRIKVLGKTRSPINDIRSNYRRTTITIMMNSNLSAATGSKRLLREIDVDGPRLSLVFE